MSGALQLFIGKATPAPAGFSATITSSIASTQASPFNLRTWALANGWDGSEAATITIDSGVYIYSQVSDIGIALRSPAITINGSWPGGIKLVNNGFITGGGGQGAYTFGYPPDASYTSNAAYDGSPAISLGTNCTIENNGTIAGGGGGGGAAANIYDNGSGYWAPNYDGYYGKGGGGAGGGPGWNGLEASTSAVYTSGTTYGQVGTYLYVEYPDGIFGASNGYFLGSSSGGYLAGAGPYPNPNSAGGDSQYSTGGETNNVGGDGYLGGGGGGWGASGGGTYGQYPWPPQPAGAGGKAVALNGYTVTWLVTGTRWGAIS